MNIYKAIIPAEPEKHRKGKLMKKKNNLTFFKGFDKNMQCRGFQYVEGKTYTQPGEIGVCENGFHACSLPLDVLSYYPVRDGNLYHEVKLDGISENDGGDSKVAAREITVGAALNLVELIKAHVNAVTTGDYAHAATTGRWANAVTTGDYAHAATTGYNAHAATTGDDANAATTGHWANAVTTGYGLNADAKSESPDAIAAVLGRGKAKGVLGGWLVLTERDDYLTILDVQAIHIDGDQIKPDTWYQLVYGKPVEA